MGYGMDELEQDQHEARLKELFDSFDTTGTGSLGQEELTDLCHMLSLEEVAPVLQQTLLQDNLLGRVRFEGQQNPGGKWVWFLLRWEEWCKPSVLQLVSCNLTVNQGRKKHVMGMT